MSYLARIQLSLSSPRGTGDIHVLLGVTLQLTFIPCRGGVTILLVTKCYGNGNKLWPESNQNQPLGLYAGFTWG